MPVYEYACAKCEGRFEYIQKISDPPRVSCEVCGGTLAKLISSTSFVLKGGGWYKDGYASAAPGGDSKKPAAAASSAEKPSTQPKTESTAAKKEPTKTVGAAG